ncbi:uncharacterized protein ACIQIH_019214 [Cyanocitta cristata]
MGTAVGSSGRSRMKLVFLRGCSSLDVAGGGLCRGVGEMSPPGAVSLAGRERRSWQGRFVIPPGGSVLLEVQRRSVPEYVWVHLWGLGETLDMKFQGCSPCWSEKQWKQFAVCFFIAFTSVPWGSRKGLLVWTDGVAGRAGNPTAPVAPSSDLAAGRKAHSPVSSPGSVTRTELVPSLGPRALVLEQPKPAWSPLVLPMVWMSDRLLFSSVLG